MTERALPEPWLRGTLTGIPAVPRAVLHALELANEDIARWCFKLSDGQLNARPGGIAPVAFHVRHIVRSVDRLLTYAEGRPLTGDQTASLKTELQSGATHSDLFSEFNEGLNKAAARIRALASTDLEMTRKVGKHELPTTVGGLLVHVADHTQRHVGQAITTAKIVVAQGG
jgi:uncharacterized damage-inducible protein DinB